MDPVAALAVFKELVLDLLFPKACVGCGKEGSFLCPPCLASLPRAMPPLCLRCGRPDPSGSLCFRCHDEPPTIDGIRSPFLYQGRVKDIIYQFKYRGVYGLDEVLGRIMADYLFETPLPAQVLVPVPLHPKGLKRRGYNQAALLARAVGKVTGLPVVESALIRVRDTGPQARAQSAKERKNNVEGAFQCLKGSFEREEVLIIDDVSTTGATLGACAQALKEAGARSVWGLTLAREV